MTISRLVADLFEPLECWQVGGQALVGILVEQRAAAPVPTWMVYTHNLTNCRTLCFLNWPLKVNAHIIL